MRASLWLSLLLVPCLGVGQTAADLASEPHHHLLLENSSVRVFGMTLHPDESAFVDLQRSFLTVALQDGEIIMWDEGKSPIQHFQLHMGETNFRCWSAVCLTPEQLAKGLSGGYRNDRQKDYRNITVEFLDPMIGWNMPEGGLLGPPGSMFIGGAIVADVLLRPGDSFPAPEKAGAELVIPLSDIELKGERRLRIRGSSGEVAWIGADQASSLKNAGRDAARFVIVQFHPDTPFAPVTQSP
jgi:hypothetical protein